MSSTDIAIAVPGLYSALIPNLTITPHENQEWNGVITLPNGNQIVITNPRLLSLINYSIRLRATASEAVTMAADSVDRDVIQPADQSLNRWIFKSIQTIGARPTRWLGAIGSCFPGLLISSAAYSILTYVPYSPLTVPIIGPASVAFMVGFQLMCVSGDISNGVAQRIDEIARDQSHLLTYPSVVIEELGPDAV